MIPRPETPEYAPDALMELNDQIKREKCFKSLEQLYRGDSGSMPVILTELTRWVLLDQAVEGKTMRKKEVVLRSKLVKAVDTYLSGTSRERAHTHNTARESLDHLVVESTQKWMALVSQKLSFTTNERAWAIWPISDARHAVWCHTFPGPRGLQAFVIAFDRRKLQLQVYLASQGMAEGRTEDVELSEAASACDSEVDRDSEYVPETFAPDQPSPESLPTHSGRTGRPELDVAMQSDEIDELSDDSCEKLGPSNKVNNRGITWVEGALASKPCKKCAAAGAACLLSLSRQTRRPKACQRCSREHQQCEGAVYTPMVNGHPVHQVEAEPEDAKLDQLSNQVSQLREELATTHQEIVDMKLLLNEVLAKVVGTSPS